MKDKIITAIVAIAAYLGSLIVIWLMIGIFGFWLFGDDPLPEWINYLLLSLPYLISPLIAGSILRGMNVLVPILDIYLYTLIVPIVAILIINFAQINL